MQKIEKLFESDPSTEQIIKTAIEDHGILGARLLESLYKMSLYHELFLRNLKIKRQKVIPVDYKGMWGVTHQF